MFGKSKKKDDNALVEDERKNEHTALKPNRTFYIVPHTGFTKVIQILDLTSLIKSSYPSEAFDNEAKEIATSSPPEPWLTVTRQPRWYSKNFVIEQPGSGELGQWKAGMFSSSPNTLLFPQDSPHSSHPITIKADNAWKFREQFVKDSRPYIWTVDNVMSSRKFTLYKVLGGAKQEIGRYEQGWGVKYGGTLVLDANEIDAVVAVVSVVNILRKKRQKVAEYSGQAGGG
ncbi:hypothetical protein EJ08DRAFT_644890 [Tothia fuscella]|uniref:Uncharacterized protein n=1 Tax=Tothia fuscella TaxID=1048955 RepID=A0A9P4P360_9PEZI|nr:hypothetical protein EJ08DRAFT_644890 [Tothia fuscella]